MLVGVDAVAVERIRALVARRPRFVARVFTEREQQDCAGKPQRWASSWAAKEAVRKLCAAAGDRLPAFRDVEVVRTPDEPPRLRVDGDSPAIALSLTHDGGLAIAVAVSGGLPPPPDPTALEQLTLPARPDDGHKGTFGRVVVVAGARGFTGAPVLAAMGAARGGAGLVTVCVPESIYAIVATRCLEVMPTPLPDGGTGTLRWEGLDALRQSLRTADALVIGPGLGRSPETELALREVLSSLPCPTVVDADALNFAAAHHFDWRTCSQPVVITPHPAEMARLIGTETAIVSADRPGVASRYAREHGVVVVLKGAATVVAAPDGRMHTDAHRVVALATGGTGDVLAGVTGALLAQGAEPFEAAVAAVTIHAEAGRLVQRARGRAGALASDVLEALPRAQESLRQALERRATASR